MVACTFSGVTIPVYRIESMSTVGAYSFECTLRCRTDSSSNIASVQALAGRIGITTLLSGKTKIQTTGGTKASLVLNGITYPNCYIASLTWQDVPKSKPFSRWEYTVKFVEETV